MLLAVIMSYIASYAIGLYIGYRIGRHQSTVRVRVLEVCRDILVEAAAKGGFSSTEINAINRLGRAIDPGWERMEL